jgi:hypothetical protein
MKGSASKMVGLVFAHRWFPDGADWAYHHGIGGDMLRVLAQALDEELSNRQLLTSTEWRTFRIKSRIRGIDLAGIHKLDAACQDPKARKPSILVAVLISADVTMSPERIAQLLGQHVPTNPGVNEHFQLKSIMNKKNSMRIWLMRALLVAAIVAFALVFHSIGQQSDEDQRRIALYGAMQDLTGASRENSWGAFVDRYCAPADSLEGHHPDLVRLRSLLPRRERNEQRRLLTEKTLNDWARHVGLENTLNNPTSGEIESQLKAIVAQLDYRQWFEGQLRADSLFRTKSFTGSNSVADTWRARAVRLCDAQDVLLADYARTVYGLLKKWDVREVHEADVGDRPWFVIHALFAFLNRERFDLPAKEEQTAYELFVSRLPATNVLSKTDYSFSANRDVDRLLQELIESIRGELVGGMDFSSALASIEEAMDYSAWRDVEVDRLLLRRQGATDAEFRRLTLIIERMRDRDGSSEDAAINEFVRRFQVGEDDE